MNKQLSKVSIQRANKHIRRRSTSHFVRKLQIKITINTTVHILERLNCKTLATPRAGEHLEQQTLLSIDGGSVKWYHHFEGQPGIVYKTEWNLTTYPTFLLIMGWFVLPQKHVVVLTSSLPERDLVWKQGLHRGGHQSLNMTGVLIKKG